MRGYFRFAPLLRICYSPTKFPVNRFFKLPLESSSMSISSLFLGLSALFLSCAFSQSTSNSGEIRGQVLDPSGSPVPAARLSLDEPNRGFSRKVTATEDGRFTIAAVPPGLHQLKVEAPGFTTRRVEKVEVRVGDVISLQLQLSISAVESEIVVAADLAAVEVARTQQANTVEQVRINNLPINRRNFLDFALLAPGVVETTSLVDDSSYRPIQTPNSGLSFGGSNGRGNGFFIDGLENYYNTGGGVRPSVSQEAVQEFQMNRNSFSAEFGNALGGMINIITKGGANQLHGNAFGFLRHRSIQARNYFDPGKSSFTRLQSGATLGGALRPDKTFFFGSYEFLGRQETNFIPILQDRGVFNRITPSQDELFRFLEASGNPLLAGLAAQGRQLLVPRSSSFLTNLFDRNSGTFPFSQRLQTVSLRLDHKFADNHSAFFRANTTFDRQDNNTFGALDGFNRGRTLDMQDNTVALGDTWSPNANWIIESRAMFGYNRFDVKPVDPNGPEININGFGLFGRQIFLPGSNIERHYQALVNVSRLSSRHSLKFGYDFNPVRNNAVNETFMGGRFTFGSRIPLANVLVAASGNPALPNTISQLLTAAGQSRLLTNLTAPITALQSAAIGFPELYQQGFGNPAYVNTSFNHNLYVQDSWKVAPSLTLNAGLRYEVQMQAEKAMPRDYNNFAPRLGFAWSPGKSQRLVLRGGYGIYFSMLNSNVTGTAVPLSGRFINQILLTPSSTLFRDPRNGQFVTSGTIFQSALAQGILGRRTITQDDLRPFGISIGPNLPGSVVFGIDPDLVNPYAQQASLELETSLRGFTLSFGYNGNRAAHIGRIRGRNVRYTGARLPDGRPLFERVNPLILQENIFESSANSFYHAGIFQLSRRFAKGLTFNFNYTFSKAIDESTDFNSDYSPQDQLNARAERSLSAFHQAHRAVFNAVVERWGWNFAPIVLYNSWRPFNILTGFDAQGDTYVSNKRPAHLGRNMGQGPDFVTFDLRLSRRFRYSNNERRFVEFLAEGFNLLNRTNFRTINNIVGDVPYQTLGAPIIGNRNPASTPLAFTSTQNQRQFQLGLKLYF